MGIKMPNIGPDTLPVRFPTLFPTGHPTIPWIEVGEGWDPLLLRLCEALVPLVEAYNAALDPAELGSCVFTVDQVKEKFGGLRFYVSGGTDEMYVLISAAEAESFRTCETCGEPGVPRKSGWIKTACDGHSDGKPPIEWERKGWEDL